MSNMFIKDYKNNNIFRKSLNTLAKETFGLDFEEWYQAGFWGETYTPYSIVQDNAIIANASANTVELTFDGKLMKAVMIGTVMTDKAHRGKGYSAQLIHRIIDEYRGKTDFIYLFANNSVLDFYPKFGFSLREERQCFAQLNGVARKDSIARALNISNNDDLAILLRLTQTGKPARKRLSVMSNQSLILFYCMCEWQKSVYYYPDMDTIVFYHEGVLLDYFSGISCSLSDILPLIVDERDELPLGFTPENEEGISLVWRHYNGNLFIQGGEALTGDFMFPSLSRA